MPDRKLTQLLMAAALCLGVGVAVYFWDQEAFLEWSAGLDPWVFFLVMTVAPAFGVPTSPFYILAGLSFGPLVGLGGGALAIAGNLLLVYGIGHSGLRTVIDQLLEGKKFQLPSDPPKRPIRYTVLVKFAPGLPAFLKNYILVLSKVPFWLYFTASFIFSFVYALLFYLLGDSIQDRETGQGLTVVALIVLVAGLAWYLQRRVRRRKSAENEAGLSA